MSLTVALVSRVRVILVLLLRVVLRVLVVLVSVQKRFDVRAFESPTELVERVVSAAILLTFDQVLNLVVSFQTMRLHSCQLNCSEVSCVALDLFRIADE